MEDDCRRTDDVGAGGLLGFAAAADAGCGGDGSPSSHQYAHAAADDTAYSFGNARSYVNANAAADAFANAVRRIRMGGNGRISQSRRPNRVPNLFTAVL